MVVLKNLMMIDSEVRLISIHLNWTIYLKTEPLDDSLASKFIIGETNFPD